MARQSEQRFEVIDAPPSLKALDGEAGFSGLFLFDQIQGDGPLDGEVLGAVADANAEIILGEGHVHHPVAAVFDRPVGSHLAVELGSFELKAANVVTPLDDRLILIPPGDELLFRLNHHDTLSARVTPELVVLWAQIVSAYAA